MISENDFEDYPPAQNEPVARQEKHAYKTVVLTSQSNPSPSLGISRTGGPGLYNTDPSGVSVIGGDGEGVAVEKGAVDKGGRNLDKINNLAQKEIALGRVGVTREKAYKVIAQALDAKKWADVIDRQGNVKQEYVDDLEKQRWGAEMAIKMFGDMIERKEIEHDLGDKTLDRLRALTVTELKARAADILLGKKAVIAEAEVVSG